MPWLRANMTAWLYEYAEKNSAVFVETHQSVQFVPTGHRTRSFQATFRDSSKCRDYRFEENSEDNCL